MSLSKKKPVHLSNSEKKLLKDFGNQVRALREKMGLSVYDVTGKDMPIRSRQHWQRIENGQKNINLTTVARIAKSLNKSVSDLMTGL